MASSSKEIILQLKAENEQLKAKLADSIRAIDKMKDKASGLSDALGKLKGLFIGGAVAKFGASIIKASADMETFETSFTVMLGSGEKAKGLLKEIEDVAGSTSFQFPELVTGAERLLAFGVESEDVTEKMINLGNASKGNADVLDRLTLSYGKALAKGKASMEEVNAMTEAGVPILKELERMYGVNQDKVLEFISAGKVGFKDLDTAMTNLTTGGGQFAGMMEKQSKTLTGAFSTLQDQFWMVARSMGDAMLPALKNLVGALGSAIESGGVLTKVFGFIGSAMAAVINTISVLTSKFSEYAAETQSEYYMMASRIKQEQAMKLLAEDRVRNAKEASKLLKEAQTFADTAMKYDKQRAAANESGSKYAHEILFSNKELTKEQEKQVEIQKRMASIKPPELGGKGKPEKDYWMEAYEESVKKRFQAQVAFQDEWNARIAEQGLSEVELMQRQYEDSLARAEEFGYNKLAITTYWEEEIAKKKAEIDERERMRAFQARQTLIGGIQSQLGQLSQLYAMETQAKVDSLQRKQQAEIEDIEKSAMTEEQKKSAIEKVQQKYERKQKAEQLKAWQKQKTINMAQALLDIPMVMMNAYTSMSRIPVVGHALGIAMALTAGKFAKDKYKMIARSKPPVFKKGYVPSFQNGYIPDDHYLAYVGSNEAVMTAQATRANSDILRAMNNTGGRVAPQNIIRTTIPIMLDKKQIGVAVDEYRDGTSKRSAVKNYYDRGAF